VQEAVSQWRLDTVFTHYERQARLTLDSHEKIRDAKGGRQFHKKPPSAEEKLHSLPSVTVKENIDHKQPRICRSVGKSCRDDGTSITGRHGRKLCSKSSQMKTDLGSRRSSVKDGLDDDIREPLRTLGNDARTRLLALNAKKDRKEQLPDKFELWRHESDLRRIAQLKEKEKAAPVTEVHPHEDIKHIFQAEENEVSLETMLGRGYEIRQLAQELKMPLDAVQLAKKVFDSFDVDGSGNLDIEEFESAVARLLEYTLNTAPPERVKAMSDWQWWDADAAKPGTIDFHEFLKWYASNSFKEDLLLTPLQKELRSIAKRFGVSPDYVERAKQHFDSCIKSGSTDIGFSEFAPLLYKALKVPAGSELPTNRVRFFWSQIDLNSSGRIDFSEFFEWWMSYFSPTEGCKEMPIETFYRSVRRIGGMTYDPPANIG